MFNGSVHWEASVTETILGAIILTKNNLRNKFQFIPDPNLEYSPYPQP